MMNIEERTNEIIELDNEALVKASGGDWNGLKHVGKYDGVIGESYFFVCDSDPSIYHYGMLVRSFEEKVNIFWRTKRMHIVRKESGQMLKLCGDTWSMYYGSLI